MPQSSGAVTNTAGGIAEQLRPARPPAPCSGGGTSLVTRPDNSGLFESAHVGGVAASTSWLQEHVADLSRR
ncbi:hypothetical protein JZ751_008499 [Albula glossodonta]|uniref:Uncharacterized protein n=1 Tax=Albula glossodonta TaxID=121402 RepID=A0A8T2N6J1_9TELE|nr:hypothetical protein JZ751_008499 [Albula glossodonta]